MGTLVSGFMGGCDCSFFAIVVLIILSHSGPYFKNCISETDLDELNIEIIRNALYKVIIIIIIIIIIIL